MKTLGIVIIALFVLCGCDCGNSPTENVASAEAAYQDAVRKHKELLAQQASQPERVPNTPPSEAKEKDTDASGALQQIPSIR